MNDADDEDRFYNEHAALLGHVTLAWNDCQSMVMQIFHALSGTSWAQSTSVFLALKSDQSQRDITVALLLAVLNRADDDGMRQLGTSLVGQLGSLAGERNAAISCVLRNISEGGVALDVSSQVGIPDQFTLIVHAENKVHSCAVVWRSERRLGVTFR